MHTKNFALRRKQDHLDKLIGINQLNFGDALEYLKYIDQEGWEAWFDANMPDIDESFWKNTEQVNAFCDKMYAQAGRVDFYGGAK